MSDAFDIWGLVEVMGHRRYAGHITEQVVAGCGFVRVDVPAAGDRAPFTKLIGTSSVYGITPLDEETARAMVASMAEKPIEVWGLREHLQLTDGLTPPPPGE